MTIENIYNKANTNKNKEFFVILIHDNTAEMFPLSYDYYIESNICNLFTDDTPCSGEQLVQTINEEATDKCWLPRNITDRNKYLSCEINIVNGDDIDNDDIYDITDIIEQNNRVILLCELI